MIEQWSLANFKSIQSKVSIDLAPLTIFVGQNSAGKSTLIQSILLTAQTLQSSVLNRGCILNGRIIKLGSFSDIRSNASKVNAVTVGFTLANSRYSRQSRDLGNIRYYFSSELALDMKNISCSYTFSNGHGDNSLEMQPRLDAGFLIFDSNDESEKPIKFSYRRSQLSREDRLRKLGVLIEDVPVAESSTLDFEPLEADVLRSQRRALRLPQALQPAGAVLKHFLPAGLSAAYDAIALEVDGAYEMLYETNQHVSSRSTSLQLLEKFLKDESFSKLVFGIYSEVILNYFPEQLRVKRKLSELHQEPTTAKLREFLVTLSTSFRRVIAIKLAENEQAIKTMLRHERKNRMVVSNFPAHDQVGYAADYVSAFFTEHLKYLGPLRDEPKAIYPTGSNDPKDVGFRGEFTAAVLDNNKSTIVRYIASENFPVVKVDNLQPISVSLREAVGDWLEYLGIARKVESEDKGKLGHELTIATNSSTEFHDLTHVGVGVSQALPIVVLSLLAEKGSTLIFEQPELHLHPRVQSRLADFFMSLIFSGKQCIVETHSEYLISRLRLLSAKAEGPAVSKNIGIYFVEKDGGQSKYRKVEVTESGSIKNWPDGFFDEAEQNAAELIEAQITMARSKSNRGVI